MWKGAGTLDGFADARGWAELGGGLMLQWGFSDGAIGANKCSSATFRKPFYGNPYSATASPYNAGTGTNDALTTQSYSSNSMIICQTGNGDSGPVYATYLVVGRMP